MGGNGAYIASEGGVPMRNRTHNDTEYRIDGHKVLVQAGNPKQKKDSNEFEFRESYLSLWKD